MIKKLLIGALVFFASVFIAFQLFYIFRDMFTVRPTALAGEEDIVLRGGDGREKKLAFACNVDWGEEIVPGMLEICRDKDVKITFFVTGRWAKNNPYLLRKMYVAGHEIENHGYRHKLCSQISADESRNEIRLTEEAVYELLGVKTTIFAPPSGDYDSKTLDLCKEMGYIISLWTIDTIDWRKGSSKEVIRDRVMKKELDGAIVLMHPKSETAKALPGLIDEIRGKDIEIVTVHYFRDQMKNALSPD